MLQLGQWVQIDKSPTYGADYFDNDYMGIKTGKILVTL